MKHGFIKVASASPHVMVADCMANAHEIIGIIKDAYEDGVKLLVLPELSITAYTCGDLFLSQKLINSAASALETVIEATAGRKILCAVGLPAVHNGKLYNCAAILYNGKILGFIPKSNIPNYSEFYEYRHFTPASKLNSDDMITFGGVQYPFGVKLLFRCSLMPEFCFAAEICEDLWVTAPPSVAHAAAGATIIINLSASDETVGKSDYRRELVSSQSARLVAGYIYTDAGEGESTTDMVFAGHNLIAENGVMLAEKKPFSDTAGKMLVTEIDVMKLAAERRRMTTFPSETSGYRVINFDMALVDTCLTRTFPQKPFVPSTPAERMRRCEEILTMQASGLKKRITAAAAKSVVIGISGGLDSTLALIVAVRAMDALNRPHTDVTAVTMPCFGTTKRTRGNAEVLCERLGVSFRCVDITESVSRHFHDIGHNPNVRDVTYENTQARERTQVLMDIAGETGGFVVGTGDLSELALGWATYNGDHMSMYGVNASVPKTLIRHIVKYYADVCGDRTLSDVLSDILDTPVSPELLPADESGDISQKTEDIVGPYELHDFFLYYMVRCGFAPSKIFRMASYTFGGIYEPETVLKWLKIFIKRFFAQQFKRSCMPDGPKVGSVTLSPRGDWRMPSDASSKIWMDELDSIEL